MSGARVLGLNMPLAPAFLYLLTSLYSINRGQMLDSEHSAGNGIQLALNNTT